jgi:hypothetical protein
MDEATVGGQVWNSLSGVNFIIRLVIILREKFQKPFIIRLVATLKLAASAAPPMLREQCGHSDPVGLHRRYDLIFGRDK